MASDIKKLFGRRIKELRKKKNLSQEQFSEMINVVERNVSNIECGNNFVTAETLQKIADALCVRPRDLFDFDHLKDEIIKKEELINAINNNELNIDLLYKIYKAINK